LILDLDDGDGESFAYLDRIGDGDLNRPENRFKGTLHERVLELYTRTITFGIVKAKRLMHQTGQRSSVR
jgi:hypothetical protein